MSTVANNRFLQRTNPVMRAAITDGGSVLGNEYIQRSARQMVNKDIYQYLVDWNDRDLVKTRTSGTDLFIPKAYDISPNENDGVQATDANQPLLQTKGMKFDGTNDYMESPYTYGAQSGNPLTIMTWLYIDPAFDWEIGAATANTWLGFHWGSNGRGLGICGVTADNFTKRVDFRLRNSNASYNLAGFGGVADGVYAHIVGTWDGVDTIELYVNGTSIESLDTVVPDSITATEFLVGKNIIVGGVIAGAQYLMGEVADTRIFEAALSATDIKDIHDLTNNIRGYYV